MNDDGSCSCDEGWTGQHCEFYGGECDGKCINCSGPSAYECIKCTYNAHRDYIAGADEASHGTLYNDWVQTGWPYDQTAGSCICNDGWSGDTCEDYIGECAPTCKILMEPLDSSGGQGCTKDKFTCVECVDNAGRNEFGECVCEEDWNGSAECNVYSGKCDPLCKTCNGPSASDCLECHNYAEFDNEHICVCPENYAGVSCELFAGACDLVCEGCFGPTAKDCYKCTSNAKR